jgi:hypothetical protein
MRNIIFALFLFGLVSSALGLQPKLTAANKNETKKSKKPFKHSFTGDEDKLYFNIELDKGLAFSNKYGVANTETGVHCEMVCSPVIGTVFTTSNKKLKEIKFSVDIINDANLNKLHYEFTAVTVYEGKPDNKGQIIATTERRKLKGFLKNPSLKLKSEPEFFLVNETQNHAVIEFKNSFPYSKMGK